MRNIKINNKQKMLWSLIKFSQLIDISMGNLHVDIGTERVLRLCKCLSTNKATVNLSYSHYFRHRSCFVTKFLNVSLRSGSLFREKIPRKGKGKWVSRSTKGLFTGYLNAGPTFFIWQSLCNLLNNSFLIVTFIPPIEEDSCLRILNNLALLVLR